MQEERDVVLFTDEDGNDIELEVIDYFFHDGQEYAVLTDGDDEDFECGEEGCEHEGCDHDDCEVHADVYIMKVVQVGDDMEEFVPVEEDLMEELITIVNERFSEEDDEDEDGEEDEDEEDGGEDEK